jgi:hypothetical protein
VQASYAGNGTNAVTLNHQMKRLQSLFQGDAHFFKRLFLILGKSFSTLLTAVALDFLGAEFSELFTYDIAYVTHHDEPCLSSAIGSQWLCMWLCEQSQSWSPSGCSLQSEGLCCFSCLHNNSKPCCLSREKV